MTNYMCCVIPGNEEDESIDVFTAEVVRSPSLDENINMILAKTKDAYYIGFGDCKCKESFGSSPDPEDYIYGIAVTELTHSAGFENIDPSALAMCFVDIGSFLDQMSSPVQVPKHLLN